MVILSDINAAMLGEGRDRLLDAGVVGNVTCVLANAEKLPFADSQFDCVTIGFGLRNVTDKAAALADMRRVLKPGGQLLVLEFSQPVVPLLKPLYDLYSFRVLPLLGKLVAKDEDSYRYLAESIRMHPDQETLLGMMRERASRIAATTISPAASSPCTAAIGTRGLPMLSSYAIFGRCRDLLADARSSRMADAAFAVARIRAGRHVHASGAMVGAVLSLLAAGRCSAHRSGDPQTVPDVRCSLRRARSPVG